MIPDDLKRYFAVLELEPEAGPDEIRKAYNRLKRLYTTDSPALSSLSEGVTEEERRNHLLKIEEAYGMLKTFLTNRAFRSQEKGPVDREKMEVLGAKPTRQSFVEGIFKDMKTSLRAERLRKIYNGRAVVKDVDVEVRPGEIIALLGRNGAGKTTTFQMIVGLVRPDGGSIFYEGRNISKYSTHQRAECAITYLPQENSIFLKTSVENNLHMILEIKGFRRKKRKQIARQLLAELELLPLAKQSAHSLSGGERRKLEICRSLIINPKFLLLDEPFTGIDPLTIIELQKILVRLKFRGIGIILSDHNVRDTLRITDRAYIIDQGEILVVGSPREIVENEQARESFLGRNFKLGEEREAGLF